jgi:hypothetical protein
MRNIFTLLLITIITTIVYSQDVNDNVRFIPQSEVPKAVVDHQEELFPTNFVSEWQVQEVDGMQDAGNIRYIAKFEEDARPGFSASYLPNGILVFNSEFMPSEIIPAEVRLKVDSEYKDYTIQSADFITFYNPKREIYMVKILKDISMQYVFYNTVGNKIPRESLPPEMLLLMR